MDFINELKRRSSETKATRWVRFAIVALLYLGWVIWMQRAWLLIFLPLLYDIYITGFIPFTWWKHSKNKLVRNVMSWVDAIVYSLILVYFVFAFVGQNYQIPSSSLEKTLLTGDYLWVNKVVYGPRVPMTPIHFPLVHNTLFGCKSYLDSPSNSYRRLKGLRSVETGDIVVFNFPAGDTVASRFEESPKYYDLLVKEYGRERLHTDKATFGDIIYRPVDRRQNFVKRAIGLPGQRIKIVNDTIYIDGKALPFPENVQFNYVIAMPHPLSEDFIHELGITASDVQPMLYNEADKANIVSWMPGATMQSYLYGLPLTAEMIQRLTDEASMQAYIKFNQLFDMAGNLDGYLFPDGAVSKGWTLANYGGRDGILIPRKGLTVRLNEAAWLTYHRCIRNYEGHTDAYFKDGVAYIGGKPAATYTFAMDYYFMMGDNRDCSQDSRFWGFVPEDHIVGTPMFVLISIDNERSIFDGGIRWNRIFRSANPDKQ
ncbi:MAG: S26 family signal peptidase [Muribaculaceae bacterium]